MAAVSGAFLLGEVHGLSDDGTCVITVQHWKPRALVTFRNGERCAVERGTRERVAARFAQAEAVLARRPLTEDQARAKLLEFGAGEPAACPGQACGDQLPVGEYRCVRCGMSPRRHAAGAMSGATRRPAIVIRTGP